MKKLYFDQASEFCLSIESHLEAMKENGQNELILFQAKRESGTGYFFCNEFMEIGEVRVSCGRMCEKYLPNNGKSGRCKHYGYVYEPTNKQITLTLK